MNILEPDIVRPDGCVPCLSIERMSVSKKGLKGIEVRLAFMQDFQVDQAGAQYQA
ncbi:MAG: hypothetical protein R8G34_07755 [Paracoccaceae bacterium]|nr:hypothetical protein [Paracoccaceae bacterium]